MEIIKLKDNTFSIAVPSGVRYLSNWNDFELFNFPHIMDKQIPGCGFTEFCLTNDQDLVLCSPRKLLLENKYDQHKDDIYYVLNSLEITLGVDKDLTKRGKARRVMPVQNKKTPEEIKQEKLEYYNKLKGEIENYILKRRSENKPFKIIVTYDSFYLVKGILKEIPITLSDFVNNKIQYVVDEFQSIFTDATFKSSTENDFLDRIKDIKRICFVSATPMIEEYLRLIDNFKDLPYYELDWSSKDSLRVKKPELDVRLTRSITASAKEIIESYLSGKFETRYVKDGNGDVKQVESREAVFYLNSVNNILTIVKKMKLTKDQVNILCADTPENQKKIKKKLGAKSKITIGRVPLKGEPHKMFTFCTRTVYLGADFYSTCARSFILSDANIETLAVDISLDLPQILGRQRLKENPWKDCAKFFYNPLCTGNITSKEMFDEIVKNKYNDTMKLLTVFEGIKCEDDSKFLLAKKFEKVAQAFNYSDDYVAVNNNMIKPGYFVKTPVLNKLVMIAEQRAFDIQQIDYRDRFSVFSAIENNNITSPNQEGVIQFFDEFEKLKNLRQKLKFFCEYQCEDDLRQVIYNQITEKHFHEYIDILGSDVLKKDGYNITKINKRLGIITFNNTELLNKIYSTFIVGEKYLLATIKESLTNIYTECGYEKAPKATDLEKYFEIKIVKLINPKTGKRVDGYEIKNKKL
jgi:hypothetical protein